MTTSRTPPATSDERYETLQKLGEGANGDVYLALDHETGEQVALKRLTRLDHKAVRRLKREFRALADLRHPNLVKVYDLLFRDAGWYLVMEYIAGVDLSTQLTRALHAASTLEVPLRPPANRQLPDDSAALVRIFHQLAVGVHALHGAGMLHRDLKPSNVRLSGARVVLLDFGLVRDLAGEASLLTQEGSITGTPAYMAPEQATGEALSEASDWYALGVMLYEALSGRLPIEGRNVTALLRAKRTLEPEPLAAELQIPEALRSLCMDLLQREPAARPQGSEVVERLQQARTSLLVPAELPESAGPARGATHVQLIGRDGELEQLRAALTRGREHAVVVHLHASSGAGKSALLEAFLDEIAPQTRERGALALLRSRCYEREAIPFKALDGIVETLIHELSVMDELEVAYVIPSAVGDLTQLFPGFERLPAVRRLLRGARTSGPLLQIRQRGERALRELLERFTGYRYPVIAIDDLHWGDRDSANLLRDWLRVPLGPALLILSYRSEEIQTSPCLRTIFEDARPLPTTAAEEVQIQLEPLSDREVERMCEQTSAAPQRLPDSLVERIVREAQGNPFLAQQLAALARAKLEHGEHDPGGLSLGHLVTRTSALLPASARALLDVLAIAGRPLTPRLALAAAGSTQEGRAQIHALQGLHLLRMRDMGDERLIDVYHDRIRQAVLSEFSAQELERTHLALLHAAEAEGGRSDPAWLHVLSLGAGAAQREAALRYGLLAAEQAQAGFAFERAAELYAKCVTLCEDTAAAAALWVKLANALAWCRRGAAAAEAYLEASKHVPAAQAVMLVRAASSHYLRSGRFEEGDRLVRRVLEAKQLTVPTGRSPLLVAIGWELAWLALHSDAFEVRPGAGDTDALAHAELYGSLAIETLHYAPLRAVLFQLRALRFAHAANDPAMFARAICLNAAMHCIAGTARATRRAEAMLKRAEELNRRHGDSSIEIEVLAARAISAMLLGRPADVLEPALQARRVYEAAPDTRDAAAYYYLFVIGTARVGALQNLGRYLEAANELREMVAEARATDNRAALLIMTLPVTLAEQMADQCAHSRERLDQERLQLPTGEFSVIHLQHVLSVLRAGCMNGEFAWANRVLEEWWPQYLASPVHRGAYLAYAAHTFRARLLLNQYARVRRPDPVRLVAADRRALEALPSSPFRNASLFRLQVRLAFFGGDRTQALQWLVRSEAALTEAGFSDEVQRERYARGLLLGGAEGQPLVAAASQRLRELGSSDPERDMRGYYPELFLP